MYNTFVYIICVRRRKKSEEHEDNKKIYLLGRAFLNLINSSETDITENSGISPDPVENINSSIIVLMLILELFNI